MLIISKNYRIIREDANNIAIQKYKPPKVIKTGKKIGLYTPEWKSISWHSSLRQALIHAIDNEINLCDNAAEILDKLNKLQTAINSMSERYLNTISKGTDEPR